MTDNKWEPVGIAVEPYELYMVPAITEGYAKHILQRAHLDRGHRVLDLACGTGVLARNAARQVGSTGKVSALDINPMMLEAAKQISRFSNPPIEFVQGDAAKLPFGNDSFDVVLSNLAVMIFPDRVAALKELNRVATPGGRLVYSVWRPIDHAPAWQKLSDAFEKHVGHEAGAFLRMPFITGGVDDARTVTTQAGWKDVKVEVVVQQIRYPSFSEFIRQETESFPFSKDQKFLAEKRAALLAEVTKTLAHYGDDFGMSFPTEAYFITARK